MHRLSRLAWSETSHDAATIAHAPLLPFLAPALSHSCHHAGRSSRHRCQYHVSFEHRSRVDVQSVFFSACARMGNCQMKALRKPQNATPIPACLRKSWQQSRALSGSRVVKNNGQDLDQFFQQAPYTTQRENRNETLRRRKIKGEALNLRGQVQNTAHRVIDWEVAIALEQRQQNSGLATRIEAKGTNLTEQLRLVKAVRQLEKKLAKARFDLHKALQRNEALESPGISKLELAGSHLKGNIVSVGIADSMNSPPSPIVLTKDDYLNLVDLYFYSHQGRFAKPESPDLSPTPVFLEDYSFKLSADFSNPTTDQQTADEDDESEERVSPLKHIGEVLRSRQLHETAAMQAFVDLLLDDHSPNRALYEAYKTLPDPGVAYLPSGVIRVFLQRMSKPWTKSEKSMLRYLSLIDDMQKAGLPITNGEWSSAIYLAGRSFTRVTDNDVATSFRIWRQMENEAGVQATHVTFNILFDIAVRAGKFVLADTILQEMHERGLRLNRLGRVSLIYYHGCRGDGDGVRKTYRDFVESGEIVDTLVLNCVMASLIKAQEPTAAEQIYERMKRLQERLREGRREDGENALFMKYPPPGPTRIGTEMASNHLGRILLHAAKLRDVLPEHHAQLQSSMPLTPDYITFRNLISHHANTSGDLDRLVVLMGDMQQFNLGFGTLSFQLLFKGFAIHGGSKREEAKWTLRRLELVWQECLGAIRKAKAGARELGKMQEGKLIELPTIEVVDRSAAEVDGNDKASKAWQAQIPQQTAWGAFLADFTSQPGERGPFGPRSSETFSNPFFPNERVEPSMKPLEPDPDTDYLLPAPEVNTERSSLAKQDPFNMRASQGLVTWVIRAYAKCTGSRSKLEEVWYQIKRVWKPADARERDAVVWALRHALKQCDRAI